MHMQTTEAASTTDATAQESAADPSAIERNETREEMQSLAPSVDIYESSEELLLVFDVPGVVESAIELRVERGDLSLSAEDSARNRVFRRAFTLPDSVDPERVSADLKSGVLSVHLGKREEPKPRRIEIRTR